MELQEIRTLLERHEFFRGLDPDAIAFVAGCGTNVRFAAGEYVFHEGDPADRFFIVRAGRVALEIHSPDRGPVVVDTVREGEILGVSWLFPPYRCESDAHATEMTRAVSLDATCLRTKCEENPRLGYELMKRVAVVMSKRIQSARVRLLDLYGHARSS